jgi:hypothetical protein
MTTLARKFLAVLLTALVALPGAQAQERQAYSQAELDQMLAPIALYPDALLSQVLMAATYPLEVVEAARWSRAHPGLQGDEAVRAAQDKDWDPSVKSLLAFPNLLARMDEKLDWTKQLGDAFLAQEQQVMDTVQDLRRRAKAAGQLASDDRVHVVDEGGMVAIGWANPLVVYVPYYDPWVVYGSWWWPAYPPVVWAPWQGYVAVRPGIWWGFGIRISTGFFFGTVSWPQRHVIVTHVTNYYVRPPVVRRTVIVHRAIEPGRWQHDPSHRRGVVYRSPEVQRRYVITPPPQRELRQAPRPGAVAPAPRERRELRPEPRPGAVAPAPRERRELRQEPRPGAVAPAPREQRELRQEPRPAPQREERREERRDDRRGQYVMPPAFRASAPERVEPRYARRAEARRAEPRAESRPVFRVEQRGGGSRDGGWRHQASRLERRG